MYVYVYVYDMYTDSMHQVFLIITFQYRKIGFLTLSLQMEDFSKLIKFITCSVLTF